MPLESWILRIWNEKNGAGNARDRGGGGGVTGLAGAIPGRLAALLAAERLGVLGGFHPGPEKGVPEGTGTLLMLGPEEPGFWAHVTAQREFADGGPDPLDRWSARAIGRIAKECGAAALFPFGGPPFLPFIGWALRTGRAWQSPVGLLVHDRAGLMVSWRGALALPERLDLPEPGNNPCISCAGRPCIAACPAHALHEGGYNVPLCHDHLEAPEGESCMTGGCLVRRACPVSQRHGRLAAQSAFHMRAFHR